MAAPQSERRRLPRGPDLPAKLSTGWVRWVYLYAIVFAVAVLLPAVLSWYFAEPGSPERASAGAALGTIVRAVALPLAVLALAAAIHGGTMARRVGEFVGSFKRPLECLRADLARHQRRSREVVEQARRMTAAVEDPDATPGEILALANSVQDAAEQLVSRPAASLETPGAPERAREPENEVAAALP